MVTVGNFFSGSGTWELAGKICGAKPIWESEIEPFPVELEAKRFPECKQLGDITKVSGYDIEPCDIMTNSSPCQDISVAGKRKGMEQGSDTRSSLFHEVIRITKEMRERELEQLRGVRRSDEHIRFPRPYIWCWENVCGALSSNNGNDFREVLEEIAKIISPDVSIPMPKGNKWSNAGCVDGNGWSIAWCVRNAANEGVPQRRRRIFLVADFTGASATKILFERKGVFRHFAEINASWQETTYNLAYRIAKTSEYVRGTISTISSREVEIWLPVKDYEGLYEVSDRGRVRRNGKILKDQDDRRGYRLVDLSKNGEVTKKKVHRLVAEAFLSNPDNLPCINHKDENRANNDVDNLEWCTQEYNVNYGTAPEKRAEKAKRESKPVIATLPDGTKEEYTSSHEAARVLNGSQGSITSALTGRKPTAYGRTWEYAEKNG